MAKIKFALKLYELQQEIEDCMDGKIKNRWGENYRFFIPIFGRQSGKSFLAKKELLEHAANRDEVCMWVSPTINSARDHWNDMVKLLTKSGLPCDIKQASKEIHFPGGGVIYIRSAIDPDNLRGATLNFLIMDEAAYFRNGEYVWYSVLMPMITASRGIVMFPTTPNGRNWVWKLYMRGLDPNDKYYKSWHMSSLDAPYQDKELLLDLKKTMPSHKWKTEYEAEFLIDGGGCFVGVEKAARNTLLSAPIEGHSYVAGVDFGFNNDFTTFTVIDKYTRSQVYGTRFTDVGTVNTVDKLLKFAAFWKPEVIHLEKNGIGETLFSLIKAKLQENETEVSSEDDNRREINFGSTKIRAIHMDNAIKRGAVERVAADIEYDNLSLLDDKSEYGETQISEMSTYIKERTASGMEVTYNAQEGAQDDTVSGLYLAYMGIPKKGIPSTLKKPIDKQRRNPFKNRPQTIRSHRRGRYASSN